MTQVWRNERSIEARAHVDIFVNKIDREIYLLKAHITKIGYGQSMGYLIPTNRELLKTNVLSCLEDSISAYQQEVEVTDPFKASPYKTWNKFFKYHDYIPVRYNKEKKIYYISMNRRDEKTRSYMEPLPNCEFTLTEEEFDERFDEIMDFLISKVEMIK